MAPTSSAAAGGEHKSRSGTGSAPESLLLVCTCESNVLEFAPFLAQDVVTYRAQTYVPDSVATDVDAKPTPLPGSLMAFTVNGTLQGVAYRSTLSSPPCSAMTSRRHVLVCWCGGPQSRAVAST